MKKIRDSLFIILTIVTGTAAALALAILMAMAIDWLFARGDVPIVTGFAQGDILLYVGNVLPFIATLILSTLVLWQNFKLSDANEKLQRRGEEMQEKDLIHKSFNFLHIGTADADFAKSSTDADTAKHIVLKAAAGSGAESSGEAETTDIVFNFEAKAAGNVPINEIEVEAFELALNELEGAAKVFSYEANAGKSAVFDVHRFISDDENDEDHMFSVACKVESPLQDISGSLKVGDTVEVRFNAAYVNVLNVKVCLESTLKLKIISLGGKAEETKCEFNVFKESIVFTGEISVKPDAPDDIVS